MSVLQRCVRFETYVEEVENTEKDVGMNFDCSGIQYMELSLGLRVRTRVVAVRLQQGKKHNRVCVSVFLCGFSSRSGVNSTVTLVRFVVF